MKLEETIINKNLMINELITEMNEIGIEPAEPDVVYHQLEMQTRKLEI